MKLQLPLREEVMPKNILMIGPTGVGKTEVARRLAKLAGAPFIKVEATKYTEVGFHGKVGAPHSGSGKILIVGKDTQCCGYDFCGVLTRQACRMLTQ